MAVPEVAAPEAATTEANQIYLKATSTISASALTRDSTLEGQTPEPWIPGPIVDGAATKLYIFRVHALLNSQTWEPFVTTINHAYSATHKIHHILGSKPRVAQSSEYLSAIGGGTDEAFTVVCTAGDSDQVLATVSAHEWTAPDPGKGELHPMARGHGPVTGNSSERTSFWEIKLLAVHPDLQRRGLAGSMLRYAEKKITDRHAKREHCDRLVIVLSTIREINLHVYANKGYTVDYEVHLPAGTLKSERPFTLTHMSKRMKSTQP